MPHSDRRFLSSLHRLSGAAFLLGALFCATVDAQITSLDTVQSIPTVGAVDIEPFSIDGVRYLAVANHYNGSSFSQSSKIYRWSGAEFFEIQSIPTFGATDWEFFTIDGAYYLTVSNYRDDAGNSRSAVVYRWDGGAFVEYQSLPVSGTHNTTSFNMDGDTYLVAGNYRNANQYNLDSQLYRWDGAAFSEVQSFATHGVADWHYFTIGDQRFLAVANLFNGTTRHLDSVIYRWDGAQFSPFQTIPTYGAADWESFTRGGEQFLVVANYRSDSNFNIDSVVYRWDGDRFSSYQTIPTHGAHAITLFERDETTYLAVANHHNGSTYNVDSVIYRWEDGQFVSDQIIATHGAQAITVYDDGGVTNLVASNYFNGSSYTINSVVYRANTTRPPLADFTTPSTHGASPFTVSVDAGSSVDPDGGAIVDYQWSTSDAQSAAGPTAEFTFDLPGSYSITLTVTDDEGESAQHTVTVQVEEATAGGNCEGRASFSAVDGRLQLPLMDVATVPLLGGVGRPAGDAVVPTTATLRIIPGTTLFEIEEVLSAAPDPEAADTCHAAYSIDGVLTVPVVDVPVVTAIGGLTVTTGVDSFSATLELLPMSDLFTLTEIHRLP